MASLLFEIGMCEFKKDPPFFYSRFSLLLLVLVLLVLLVLVLLLLQVVLKAS